MELAEGQKVYEKSEEARLPTFPWRERWGSGPLIRVLTESFLQGVNDIMTGRALPATTFPHKAFSCMSSVFCKVKLSMFSIPL